MNMMTQFGIPTISNCFQKLAKTCYLLLDFFKTCQSVSIRNINFLNFNFITTILPDILDKNRYQNNTSWSRYLSVDHWPRLSWKMLTYDNLTIVGLSQGNLPSKLFWLKKYYSDIFEKKLIENYMRRNSNIHWELSIIRCFARVN